VESLTREFALETQDKQKVIKRYANRRLYDSDTSKTITLEDLAEFIKDGHDVQIIDNITGKDITPKILGQVFLKVNLGGVNNEFNVYLLTSLIREGTRNIQELFRKLVQAGLGAAELSRARIETLVDEMVQQGHMAAAEKVDYINDLFRNAAQQAEKFRDEVTDRAEKLLHDLETDDRIENLSQRIMDLAGAIKDIQDQNRSQTEETETTDSSAS
jgi:polyhydroxyalkanoate synthesis repressor PhaR